MTDLRTRYGLSVLVLAAFTGLGGCQADPARDRSSDAVTTLVTTRMRLIGTEQKIEASVKSVQTLADAQGDLRPAFSAFREQIKIVSKEADRIRLETDDVRTTSSAYCEAREADVNTIADTKLRQIGVERAKEVRTRYTRVDSLYGEVNTAFAQYLTNMQDLQTYLANDLNFPALHTARPWLDKTHAAGERLRGRLNELVRELDETSNVLSPVPMPQRQQSSPATSAPIVPSPTMGSPAVTAPVVPAPGVTAPRVTVPTTRSATPAIPAPAIQAPATRPAAPASRPYPAG